MNRLVVIGFLGSKQCYLNVSREEAERRYAAEWGGVEEVSEFTFHDEFHAYDVSEKE